MQSGSYVVHLVGCDDPHPFKHFSVRADAVAHGQNAVQLGRAERADIFAVADTNAPAAVAAVKKGNATFVKSCVRHATESEIEAASQREWEEARKGGPQALLKFLGLIEQVAPPIKRRKV
jgi:hypothetical protein